MSKQFVKKTRFAGTVRSIAIPREGVVDVELSNGKVYRIKAYQISLGLMRVPSNAYFLIRKLSLAVFAFLIVVFIIAHYTLGSQAAQCILYVYIAAIAFFIAASALALKKSRPVDVLVVYGFDGVRYVFRIEEGRLKEIRSVVEKASRVLSKQKSSGVNT